MDNINVENADDVIDSVNVITRTSQKSGKPYQMLQVKLQNGYDIELFLERAEMKVLQMLLDGIKK